MQKRRISLALRIYLAGLVQFAVVALGFLLVLSVRITSDLSRERDARAAVEAVVARLGDGDAVRRELERVEREQDARITIVDERGHTLATSGAEGDPPPPPAPPFDLGPRRHMPPGPFPPGPAPAFVIPVHLPDGHEGRAIYAVRAAPPMRRDGLAVVALVLAAVGVVSLLMARSLARPLSSLSRAARAFGKGKLDTRVNLARSDEIGDVAAAFDEMAERVTQLLRAEKELLANVSHELRTPLSRIRVALEIAEEGDAEIARHAIADIAADLAELEKLISDVLTTARLDLGEGPSSRGIPPLHRERVDLAGVLEHAASRFRSAHPDRALVVAVASELPVVDGDPVLLRRVVDNLLENAHKYSARSEGDVEISAAHRDAEIRIEVVDHGVGIAPEDLPHVFQPFFRADRSRTRATGGLGLGLALARRIVEAHQGTIAIESRVGEGTRAVVRLPVAPAD